MTATTTHVPFPERDAEELMTLSEVADILRVPINTMRWWRQRGVGPEFFKIGRHLVTTVGDVRGSSASSAVSSKALSDS